MFRQLIILCALLLSNVKASANAQSVFNIADYDKRSQLIPSVSSTIDGFFQGQQDTFTVTGSLINMSSGQVDQTSFVLLTAYSGDHIMKVMASPIEPGQKFTFPGVPFNSEWTYIASFFHKGIEYSSPVISGAQYAPGDTASVKIHVFDSTTDKSLIKGQGIHVGLMFGEKGRVHIVESLMFFNPSSMVVIPKNTTTPVIPFKIEPGYGSLVFAKNGSSDLFQAIAGGFGDWQPFYPNSVHQVIFEYDLPFDGNDDILIPMPMHMESIVVMSEDPAGRISCTIPQFESERSGPQEPVTLFNDKPTGENTLVIHCGSRIKLWLIFLGGTGLILAGLGVFFVVRSIKRRKAKRKDALVLSQNAQLLDAIIALDDQFKAGEISKETYTAKRSELKKKIEGK